ncbi:DUF308 domain-containing protein [Priestia koreensis]|uniref:DUF308 domain-containing protein n=1 Tax=Priestia koreensis TaxID=284581 RepID=UPI002052594B|nr:DUF308 domain-containing protein [Priestia koreensis]
MDQKYDEHKRYERDIKDHEPDFMEETAAEYAVPTTAREREYDRDLDRDHDIDRDGAEEGKVYGYLAIAAAILSLFFLPVILGAAGIILGFIARRKGAHALGAWSIGIGIVSLVIGIFILPFF